MTKFFLLASVIDFSLMGHSIITQTNLKNFVTQNFLFACPFYMLLISLNENKQKKFFGNYSTTFQDTAV